MALFPIHDLVREDDIRMRRRRALVLFAAMVAVPWLLFGSHHRQHGRHHARIVIDTDASDQRTQHRLLQGLPLLGLSPSGAGDALSRPLAQPAPDDPTRSLQAAAPTIDLSCAGSVTLLPKPGLGDRILVSVRRGQETALQSVVLTNDVVGQSAACDADESGDFILQMAPDRTLRIRQSDELDIRGGRFTGPVTIDGSGSGSVVLDGTGGLRTRQGASGDVVVGTVTGEVVAMLEGSGDLRIAGGRVARLTATVQGSGDLALGQAVVGDSRLVLEGSGDFTADRVEGRLDARTTGSGDITIGSLIAATAWLQGSRSGDITIRGGRIGTLTALRLGSGDLAVDAVVGNATVTHHGSGDITLPRTNGTIVGSETGSGQAGEE